MLLTFTPSSAHHYPDQRASIGWPTQAPSPGATRQGFFLCLRIPLPPVAPAADFPVPPNLTPAAVAATTGRLLDLTQQRRHCRLLQERCHCLRQVLKDRASLLRTRRDHRPDPLTPPPPLLPARPLRDLPVDDHEPDRLLRQVVRRLHVRRRHELEVGLPVLLKPLRQVCNRSRVGIA